MSKNGEYYTLIEIDAGQKNWFGEGGLDIVMGAVAYAPGYGWIISAFYFGGKAILVATDNDFWNK